MKKIQKAALIIMILLCNYCYGQDPSFSQFFSSPLNINPALTANINADWRLISNLRDQWIGPAAPYMTGSISYDRKIMQDKIPGVEEGNVMGIGGMLMMDRAMGGVAKSVWASLNLSYQIKLTNGDVKHKLGIGFGGIYGRRHVDFTRLDWEEQFTGYGFNINLPTGEAALSEMKPYISASTGLTYSITAEKSNVDFGVALFHFNKPKQTFLENDNQILAMRKVAHANFETFLNERTVLNLNGIYQFQDEAKYFSVGGAVGYYLEDANQSIINAGVWYWSKNAIVPYVGLGYKDMQFGVSYDLTVSKLNQATRKPNTFEVSVILRGTKSPSGIIPCPWK
ncbi:MAG: PorP/SprF family type IX secretion system membrane protein [Flavisolibacter sp.]|jgi:type IX secretion system PorP/SprF family membrane protein